MLGHQLCFYLLLFLTWPLRWLPYRTLHFFGKGLGIAIYYFFPKYRKRTLSNVALATKLNLSRDETTKVAKESLQSLAITCLEYAKFSSEKDIHTVATCENKEEAQELVKEGKPVIFFCGHQANWEVLFLEGTKRMPGGVAIGRPIKNVPLYNWILSIRQKYNGKIISPKEAIKGGLKALRKGCFLGIVGDQGMPDSGYSCLFLGRKAWTSPIAAILSYRTKAPLVVATTRRENGKYLIRYSPPIWPQFDAPMESEIDRLMKTSLQILEEDILKAPGQWLFSHNRWKQQTLKRINKRFRYESILIILPTQSQKLNQLLPQLDVFRDVYPTEFLTIYTLKGTEKNISLEDVEIVSYEKKEELFIQDFRFKLVFDLSSNLKLKSHFKKLAAFEVFSLEDFILKDREDLFAKSFKKAALKSDAS